MRISDWSSDVCSSDLLRPVRLMALYDDEAAQQLHVGLDMRDHLQSVLPAEIEVRFAGHEQPLRGARHELRKVPLLAAHPGRPPAHLLGYCLYRCIVRSRHDHGRVRLDGNLQGLTVAPHRTEEHTSELQSLMRISYAVFCLEKKKKKLDNNTET